MTMLSRQAKERILAASTNWLVAAGGLFVGAAFTYLVPRREPAAPLLRALRVALEILLGLVGGWCAVRFYRGDPVERDVGPSIPPPNER
jgi:hypothetical protein